MRVILEASDRRPPGQAVARLLNLLCPKAQDRERRHPAGQASPARMPALPVSAALLGPEVLILAFVCAVVLLCSCGRKPTSVPGAANDPHLTTNGTVEVTATLVEVPDGAIFERDLYDYATVLKYQVVRVHRGEVKGDVIYVGHYNPWKPRAEAADRRVKGIGGRLRQFRAGDTHRMALDVPIDDYFMGGIVNKYFGKETGPLYWAVWTNAE